MDVTVLRFTCAGCGKSTLPGRPCCGDPSVAPPAPARPKFGQRRKPVKPINRERRARVHPAQFGDQARMCRLVGCAVPRCTAGPLTTAIEPDHVTTRGAGGLDADCWPLCTFHHRQRHQLGIETFQARHGVSAEVVAGAMAERVREHECTAWPGADEQKRAICLVCLRRLPEGAP